MITITEAAANQVIKLVSREGADGHAVRVGVKGGGAPGSLTLWTLPRALKMEIRFSPAPRA